MVAGLMTHHFSVFFPLYHRATLYQPSLDLLNKLSVIETLSLGLLPWELNEATMNMDISWHPNHNEKTGEIDSEYKSMYYFLFFKLLGNYLTWMHFIAHMQG